MDRFAVFVDAGHLLAEGAGLCFGFKSRGRVGCDYPSVVGQLVEFAQHDSGLTLLRTYWYDGATDAVPTFEQLAVANLPDVKLRLGRLVYGHQKGVDALIYRDLMTLARERAIATAYLVAGDDDLREGVVDAQGMGVRVVLIGIEPAMTPRNQADPLIREADRHVVFGKDFWAPFFTDRSVPTMAVEAPIQGVATSVEDRTPSPSAEEVGRAFGIAWVKGATADEVRSLLASSPQIPYYVDRELLVSGQSALGPLWDLPDVRVRMRDGFWAGVRDDATSQDQK